MYTRTPRIMNIEFLSCLISLNRLETSKNTFTGTRNLIIYSSLNIEFKNTF